ncbi:VOC family protein [Aureimonas altamirensis]|uniref:VOC family protein n=1 Tax=Aureimonas altamirensis TaxID=370622 RepID=UPI0025579D93|nr:VOC family protein [Aureimonas altamirensis]
MTSMGINTLAIKDIEFVGKDFSQLNTLFERQLSFSVADQSSDCTVLQNGGAMVRLIKSELQAGHVEKHGTSVKEVSFYVSDVETVVGRAEAAGADVISFANGVASVEIYPGLLHRVYPAGSLQDERPSVQPGFEVVSIDHLAICLPEHDFGMVTERYREVFGLHTSHEEYVATGVTAMNSVVLTDEREVTKLVFMQPQDGEKKSQIQAFIDEFGGAGIQHIAFEVRDIVQASNWLTDNGISMLQVPDTYYDDLTGELEVLPYPLDALREANVLVDEDGTGQLLQAFTRPVFERKTVFIELVERRGNNGFGSGNIKSLFKAVEREMAASAKA